MQYNLKFFTILFFTFALLGSCKEEKPFALSENDVKMVDVLIDIYTVDAAIRDYSDLSEKDSLKKAYFNQIYELHQVDETWVQTQRARLEADPVRMDSVYSRALAALEVIKAKGRSK